MYIELRVKVLATHQSPRQSTTFTGLRAEKALLNDKGSEPTRMICWSNNEMQSRYVPSTHFYEIEAFGLFSIYITINYILFLRILYRAAWY
jgi:hypothetical protein